MPEGHPIFAEVPAEQHELAALRVPGREIDEPPVEILHLHAGRLELGDQEPDLVPDLLGRTLGRLYAGGIEPASVSCHFSLHAGEAAALGHEAPTRRDEPLDEGGDPFERVVRLLLVEEPHTC